MQRRLALAEKEKADGREKKDLQAVEQGGNARAHGINAFVPQRQIKAEKHAGNQRHFDGFFVFGQALAEKTRQQPENYSGHGQTPKSDGISAHGHEFHNQAAQPEYYAAYHQAGGGVAVGGRGGG